MPGIILEQLLNKVKDSDLRQFKDKLLPMEEAKVAEIQAKGLKTMTNLVEEAQQKNRVYMDMNDMGKESNVDGEVPKVPAVAEEVDAQSGKEMFNEFLEKLK